MSRLPENEQHREQEIRQAGEDPSREDFSRDTAATDNPDFGAVYANVSGLAPGDFPADDDGTQKAHSAAAAELVRDRNLSGVVRTIQDEGPPGYRNAGRDAPSTVVHSEAGRVTSGSGPNSGVDGTGPYSGPGSLAGMLSPNRLFLGLLLVIIAVLGGAWKYFSASSDAVPDGFLPPGESVQVPAGDARQLAFKAAGQVGDAQLREIRQQQSKIDARLDRLESDLAVLIEDSARQRLANETVLVEIRNQQEREQALVAGRFAALEQQIATRPVAEAAPQALADSPAISSVKSGPSAGSEGGWVVNLASFSGEAQAEGLLKTLQQAGIPAELQTTMLNGDTRHRLRVTGFSTREEAKRYAGELDKGLDLRGPWVSPR